MPNISAASCFHHFTSWCPPGAQAHSLLNPTEDLQGQKPHRMSVLEVPPIEVLGPLFLKEDTGKNVGHPSICSYLPQRVQQCGKLPGEAAPRLRTNSSGIVHL